MKRYIVIRSHDYETSVESFDDLAAAVADFDRMKPYAPESILAEVISSTTADAERVKVSVDQ